MIDIQKYISDSIETKNKILNDKFLISEIQRVADTIIDAYKKGNKVLTAGNGGSAADAQHMAGELVAKFLRDRKALKAMALTTDTSIITAISNDFGFENIFMRQIQANSDKGDVFIGISTSGNSKNIILALEEARKKGVITVGLVGEKECSMDKLCDIIIHVPSQKPPIIQESHLMIEHIICALVEENID